MKLFLRGHSMRAAPEGVVPDGEGTADVGTPAVPVEADPGPRPDSDSDLTMAEAVTRANAEQRKVLSRDGWVMPG